MNLRFHKNVLAKVKNTINRVRQTQVTKISQTDYLVKMNIAPLMGRRDAAYDRVEALLADKLFNYPDTQRKKIYETAVKLLDTVLKDSREILVALDNENRIEQEKSFICFLELLHSIIKAAGNLVDYELSLYNTRVRSINSWAVSLKASCARRMTLSATVK
ncbi:MAG: hypothetical protein PHH77_07810 [Victivallaceae bacterium]|nr:hypothetical protein [Victivallaceae bacterium]